MATLLTSSQIFRVFFVSLPAHTFGVWVLFWFLLMLSALHL